jgi:TRAP-type mannitol/chloroaromatic compound transport system permease small subunit
MPLVLSSRPEAEWDFVGGQEISYMKRSLSQTLNGIIDAVERWANLLGVWLIMALMVMVCADVLYRNVAGKSILGAVELAAMFMAAIVALTLAYTQKAGEHVRLELFIDKLHGRKRYILENIIIFVCLVFSVLFLVQTTKNAINSIAIQEIIEGASGLPLWPWKSIVPVGFFLLCLRLILQQIQYLRITSNSKE